MSTRRFRTIFHDRHIEKKNIPSLTSPRLPSTGALVAGKYRVEALLDCGNMGAVFRAQHEEMRRPVALKCLLPRLANSPAFRGRFLREARTAACIKHPNVVQIYDVGEHEGVPFIVMELLQGEAFDLVLARRPPTAHALKLVMEAMHGVAAAHEQKVVHRDIKPENIFIVHSADPSRSCAKVVDFGISRTTDDDYESAPITDAGETMGTPNYMSAEQLAGARDIDARSDIYAFGVILYEVLTHTYPFDAKDLGLLAEQMASSSPTPPSQLSSDISPAFDAVVLKALANQRTDRYRTLSELIDALTALIEPIGSLRMSERADATPTQHAVQPQLSDDTGSAIKAVTSSMRAVQRRAFTALALTICLVCVATWLFARPSAAPQPQHATPVLPAKLPLPTQLLPPAAAIEPSIEEGQLPPAEPVRDVVPARVRKTRATRHKPAAKSPEVDLRAKDDVAEGQRSGTLRRDAL